ncbi:hypothetical protein GSI_08841 [Ganoderma sinense ZZ0214-1]|uniref:C2H2-type domain-containing protein n=1 Tax=Ganoderma sinense ZZ0214-1 TaxID=1077348 RepID=A0A2G8S4Z2_9APHY|nr:hypothetical protein GSI_08841 [Ganoderma sinense ZZ0214-1]
MADLRCRGCKVLFNNQKSKNQHIGASPSCLNFYDKESTHFSAHPESSSRQPRPQLPIDPILSPPFSHQPIPYRDSDEPTYDLPSPSRASHPHPDENPPKRRRVMIEEVEDVDTNEAWAHEKFPRPVATMQGSGVTAFKDQLTEQKSMREQPYSPFRDRKEWGLVKWLMRRTTQTGVDEYLKLEITRDVTKPSFKHKGSMLKKVDLLPVGPTWNVDDIKVTGDLRGPKEEFLTEDLELWRRNPVECIADLLGNTAFKDFIVYEPVKIKRNGQRYYSEMCTGDWWWKIQSRLPHGATVASVVLASDKTQLSVFRGDKTAWPVYLTLANIDKEVRRKPSSHASVLLGYIPVAKLACFADATRSDAQQRLFHACMKLLLAPLIKAGKDGVLMTCADGLIRHVYPILAAYVADHPEQCLIACCKENRCPRCTVPRDSRGEETSYPLRNHQVTLDLLSQSQATEDNVPELESQGVRTSAPHPFWAELPHTDIFATISPDILHQLHKGVFKDHLVEWVSKVVGRTELDRCFASLPQCHGLRHFKTGISTLTQWTGAEAKEIEKVLLALLVGRVDPAVVSAVKALIDFIYLAQYHVHSETTLARLREALSAFHCYKDVFIQLEIREQFNIPKLHALLHYLEAIRSLGCLDGLNMETSERLHIDFTKAAYRASSRNEYTAQMTTWLQRQEALVRREAYLAWALSTIDEEVDPGEESSDDESDKDQDETAGDEDADARSAGKAPVGSEYDDAQEAEYKTLKLLLASNVRRAYQLPLTPSARRVSLSDLSTRYGAIDFLADLRAYMTTYLPSALPPNEYNTYDVFHDINILTPASRYFDNSKRICKVRASPAKPRVGHRRPAPPRFDCGLFVVDEDLHRREGKLNGVCAARIRVIFHLPSHLGYTPHALLYVQWFRPFRGPEQHSGLYTTSHSTSNKARRHSIVSASTLLRSCHLIPKYGPDDVDPDWTTDTVLDAPTDFFLNTYIDFAMFHELSFPDRAE